MLNYCCQEEEMSDKQIVIDVTPPSSEAPLSGNVLKTAVSAVPLENTSSESPGSFRLSREHATKQFPFNSPSSENKD